MTFLFWNINRKPLADAVHRLVASHQVDVLILAECPLSAGEMLVSLNRNSVEWELAAPLDLSETTRIQIFTRLGNQRIRELFAFPHATIRELSWGNSSPVLLAVVHLPSKLWNDPEDQTFVCTHLARQLVDAEDFVGHGRLLVVGDFNINPFETAMLSPASLNAESSRRVAEKRVRVINGHSYRYFYNPMWSFFGDAGSGPGGTYFYGGSKKARVPWNIFDQVLVRPDLLPFFDTAELEILTEDGSRSLLNRVGTPDRAYASDHLPILFKLSL